MTEQSASPGHKEVSDLGVLLAEDDDFTRMMLQRLLEDLRVRNIWAVGNGDDALAELAANRDDIDVVLCDLEMPGRGGLELLHALRSAESGRDAALPVIVLTAHREAEVVQQAIVFGIAGYLVKPVSRQELAQRLAMASAGVGTGTAA